MKHGGGSIMVWACFAVSGPGRLAIIDGIINSELYQQILKENVRRAGSQEKMGHAARQRPQTHKSFYQTMVNKVNVLEWPSQSP